MKAKKNITPEYDDIIVKIKKMPFKKNIIHPRIDQKLNNIKSKKDSKKDLAEILIITSYPPRECGIATYSQDLIKSLNNKFSNSLSLKVCALEPADVGYSYPDEVKYILNTSLVDDYKKWP